jgi:hypothetical protein
MNNKILKPQFVSFRNKIFEILIFMGRRIVTFEQIDFVHKKVKGTAEKTFNEIKEKLVINTDFFYTWFTQCRYKIVDKKRL